MGSNRFGNVFSITTWGESHGKAIGVVIDGCPAGLEISSEEICFELVKRAPGKPLTSPRKEPDNAEIYSGVFEGKTTGAPISIIIFNQDVDSTKYEPIKHLLRPGHANYTYFEKYGVFDYRGGGRSSARETACRVAAGAIAKKILKLNGVEISSTIKEIGGCQDASLFHSLIEEIEKGGDSLGGIIEIEVNGLSIGLGEPIYQKMEALLANAMLSLPASKGFEIGSGFQAAKMKGSEHNDLFLTKSMTSSNHSGGVLGGITSGMPLNFRVAFKPTSSIKKPQDTINFEGDKEVFSLPEGSRHDPCLTLRAPVIVEAMTALVLTDCLLMQRLNRL